MNRSIHFGVYQSIYPGSNHRYRIRRMQALKLPRIMKRSALVFAGIALAAMAAFGGDVSVHRSAKHIPGRYIVVLDSSADTAAIANAVRSNNGGRVHHTYDRGLKGLSVEITDADAQALARDSRVKYVEEDATIGVASSTPWGLDRIDQRSLPLHGTYVAGLVAGDLFGVAKNATLVPVRVLDCNGSGTISSVLAGLDWVMQDHAQSGGPAVMNMSLAGDASSALDSAVNNVIVAGVTTVVAAGNDNADACTKSPARVAGALTVGASTENDQRASFSNYGNCVDLFAPGTNVISDWYSSPTATSVSSGTSESAPFAAGVAALCLEKYPTASPLTVRQTVLAQTSVDVLSDVSGTPNRLLFSLIDALADVTGDSQLLADPSFEYGETFWTSDICTVINQGGCPPELDDMLSMMSFSSHSGKHHATLGGKAQTFHLTSETLTIPATVKKAELSFYLWIQTKGKKPTADDILTVEVRDASGAVIGTLGTFSNLDVNATYTQVKFDVTAYRGRTIRVSFTGLQSQGPPTWFLLDDVALNI